jgi:hypothetical protein
VPFAAPAGRVLAEAMAGANVDDHVEQTTQSAPPVTLKKTCRPDDPACERASGSVTYSVTLVKKTLTVSATRQSYTYFDRANVTRQSR